MARLRDEYEKFTNRNVLIMAVGPDASAAFKQYWQNEKIPFIGLPDPKHSVARMYKQEVNCVVDGRGYIRYAHYGNSMSDIPSNEELFQVIDELDASSK